MLRSQSIAYAVIGLVLMSAVLTAIYAWLPPSPRRAAADSYSAMMPGYRGLYDLVAAFDIPVRRHAGLPPPLFTGDARVLLLRPDLFRLEREKRYLDAMAGWVRDGGELVIVTDDLTLFEAPDRPGERAEAAAQIAEILGGNGLLARLGLEGLEIAPEPEPDDSDAVWDWEEWDGMRQSIRRIGIAFYPMAARASGSLEAVTADLDRWALPDEPLRFFTGPPVDQAVGRLEVDDDGTWRPAALEFALGTGRVLLVANAAAFSNAGLARYENAAIAFRLAAGDRRRPVVFDEFYHGLPAEGNWLALAGIAPFGWVGLCVLMAVLLWIWPNAVRFGPPAPPPPPSRRTITEYIGAMAEMFWRGHKLAFVLKTCRDGFLDELRAAYHVPPRAPVALIVHRMEQTAPEAAGRLPAALEAIDRALAAPRTLSAQGVRQLQERLESCRITPQSRKAPQRETA